VAVTAIKANANVFGVKKIAWPVQASPMRVVRDSLTRHETLMLLHALIALIGVHETLMLPHGMPDHGDHGMVITKIAPTITVLPKPGRDNRAEASVMTEVHAMAMLQHPGRDSRAEVSAMTGMPDHVGHGMVTIQPHPHPVNNRVVATAHRQVLLSRVGKPVRAVLAATALRVVADLTVLAATMPTVVGTVAEITTEIQVQVGQAFVAIHLPMLMYVLISGQPTLVCRVTNPTGEPTVVGIVGGSGVNANASGWNSKTKTQKR